MAEMFGVDGFVLLAPLAVLPIAALLVFVGCALRHAALAGGISLRADPATIDVVGMDIVGFVVRPSGSPSASTDVAVTQTALTLTPSPPRVGSFSATFERVLRTVAEPSFVIYSLTPSSLPVASGSYLVHALVRDGLTSRRTMAGAHVTFETRGGGVPRRSFRVVRGAMGAPIVEPLPSGEALGRPTASVNVELAFDRAATDVIDVTFSVSVSVASTVPAHDVTISPTSITVTAIGRPTGIRAGRRYDGVHTRSFPGTRETFQLVVGGPSSGSFLVTCSVSLRLDAGPVTIRSSRPAQFTVTIDTVAAGARFEVITASGVPIVRTL